MTPYLPKLPKAAKRLHQYIAEDRVIRGAWTDQDKHGRKRACLLAALSPVTGVRHAASACPATILPTWLAFLTPRLDDNGTLKAWPAMVRDYARLVETSTALDAAAWHRLEYRLRLIALHEAAAHTNDRFALQIAVDAMALCQQVIEGVDVGELAAKATQIYQLLPLKLSFPVTLGAARYAVMPLATLVSVPNTPARRHTSIDSAGHAALCAADAAEEADATVWASNRAWDRMTAAFFESWQDEIDNVSLAEAA